MTHLQQFILALAMFLSGVNFAMLYNFLTFRWERLRNKMDQFSFYVAAFALAAVFVTLSLHFKMDYAWTEALRCGVVQTISVLTTTGSVADDTTLWWTPIVFLALVMSLCGGMAGSTTGGLKAMRVLILGRNVRKILRDRLHPHAVSPVRLNGKPVSSHIITNVMVIFMVFVLVILAGILLLMLCGINATESIGAAIACITGYGPGLGMSGGFGNYAAFSVPAKWICAFLMLMGRLECLTLLVIFIPAFWKK